MSPLVTVTKAPPPKHRAPAKKATKHKAPVKKSPPLSNAQRAAKEIYPNQKVPYAALPKSAMSHAGGLIGSKYVIVQAWGLSLQFGGLLGPDGGKITQAFGQWEEVPVPRGDPFTMWKGRSLFAMTLDVIFDGWGVTPRSVEPEIKILETLASRIPGTLAPPNVRIWGAIPKAALSWVITQVDYDDGTIRDARTGARVRQEVHIHLLEYRDEKTVAQLKRAAATPKPPQKYKVKKGDDLKKIAAKLLGASGKWQRIEKANKGLRGWRIPKSFIGKTIKVPPK